MTKTTKTSDATRILRRVTGRDPKLRQLIEEEKFNARVARMVYDARSRAKLTQRELAEMIGTKQPVIARLEDADYEGHSLSILQRIAKALNQRLDIRFVAQTRDRKHAGAR